LGRYTHRVAISNHRLLSLENGQVTFSYNNRNTGKTEKTTISAVEFIRRFLLHVLPVGFMRIRHFGLFANRYKKDNLMFCRKCLGLSADLPEVIEKSVREMMEKLTGKDIMKCPFCGQGTMYVVDDLPRHKGPSGFEILHPAGTCI